MRNIEASNVRVQDIDHCRLIADICDEKGIRPEHLNDDRLGRILDKLYAAGVTELFVTVALSAARRFGIDLHSLHLDSSSLQVDGDYLARSLP